MKSYKFYLSLLVSVCFTVTGFAQLQVTQETDANALADVLVGDNEGLTVDNAVLIGAEGSAGTFSMSEIGIEDGILLTSGLVDNAVGPNTESGVTTGHGTPGDPDLDLLSAPFTTNDATILEVTFTPVVGEALEFSYVFGSDEYNEFVCSSFNDPFGFFINGGEYENENIALIPGTDIPVTINNVNNGSIGSSGDEENCTEDQLSNSEFFFDNTEEEGNAVFANCEYDGLTVVLSVSIPVEVGIQYTIRLAIADAGDTSLDSGVFIEGGSFDVIDFDCDDLQADFGDACELEDGSEGEVNMDCECEPIQDCDAEGGSILYADGSETQTICLGAGTQLDVDLDGQDGGENIEFQWVITDTDLNILGLPEGPPFNFDDAGEGNCLIWHLAFDPENSNVLEVAESEEPNAGNLEGCFDLSNSITVVREDCEPSDCESYEYYLADILEDGTTNIYEVTLSGAEASLSWVATSEYEVHIALNESDGMIYAVSKADGSFRMLNPETGDFGPVEMLDTDVSEIIGATFNADGKLLISSQSENRIYSVMLGGNEVSVFDSYSPILGGDIDFGSDGALYLATREGFGTLYMAIPDEVDSDMLVGDAPQLVTGLADTEDNNFILSHRDATTLMVRANDGTPGAPFDITLEGESFMTFNGDLASGCADNRETFEECEQVIYYTNQPPGGGDYTLYSTVLNGDGTSTNTELLGGLGSSHIGVTPDGSTVYIVGGSDLLTYDTESGTITNTVNIVNEDGANLSGFPACVVTEDGTLYIGGNNDNVYTLNPATGVATLFTSDYDVNGGDLIEAPTGEDGAGELWLITRNDATFTRLSDGTSFSVGVPEINGAAVLENGNVLLADGDGDGDDGLIEVNLSDLSIAATYDTEFDVNNGDLAATCVDPDPNPSNPCLSEGSCNATSNVYVQGTSLNGGSINPMRANADNSLGAPEGTEELVFTSLGYGGSLTFEFEGSVPNGEGDDITVIETSYFTPGCEAYEEYADVSVSADGEDFYYIGTICKSDNSVDISDAEVSLECVSYVRVSNNDGLSSTPDGFDVDGVIAIHNCSSDDEGGEEAAIVVTHNSSNTLTSFPNPSSGLSQAVFVTGQTERATLEVYDMNGRLVEGLFSGIAEEGIEYRVDFDGLALPNGVYVYRLTTDSEVVIDKFLLTR